MKKICRRRRRDKKTRTILFSEHRNHSNIHRPLFCFRSTVTIATFIGHYFVFESTIFPFLEEHLIVSLSDGWWRKIPLCTRRNIFPRSYKCIYNVEYIYWKNKDYCDDIWHINYQRDYFYLSEFQFYFFWRLAENSKQHPY